MEKPRRRFLGLSFGRPSSSRSTAGSSMCSPSQPPQTASPASPLPQHPSCPSAEADSCPASQPFPLLDLPAGLVNSSPSFGLSDNVRRLAKSEAAGLRIDSGQPGIDDGYSDFSRFYEIENQPVPDRHSTADFSPRDPPSGPRTASPDQTGADEQKVGAAARASMLDSLVLSLGMFDWEDPSRPTTRKGRRPDGSRAGPARRDRDRPKTGRDKSRAESKSAAEKRSPDGQPLPATTPGTASHPDRRRPQLVEDAGPDTDNDPGAEALYIADLMQSLADTRHSRPFADTPIGPVEPASTSSNPSLSHQARHPDHPRPPATPPQTSTSPNANPNGRLTPTASMDMAVAGSAGSSRPASAASIAASGLGLDAEWVYATLVRSLNDDAEDGDGNQPALDGQPGSSTPTAADDGAADVADIGGTGTRNGDHVSDLTRLPSPDSFRRLQQHPSHSQAQQPVQYPETWSDGSASSRISPRLSSQASGNQSGHQKGEIGRMSGLTTAETDVRESPDKHDTAGLVGQTVMGLLDGDGGGMRSTTGAESLSDRPLSGRRFRFGSASASKPGARSDTGTGTGAGPGFGSGQARPAPRARARSRPGQRKDRRWPTGLFHPTLPAIADCAVSTPSREPSPGEAMMLQVGHHQPGAGAAPPQPELELESEAPPTPVSPGLDADLAAPEAGWMSAAGFRSGCRLGPDSAVATAARSAGAAVQGVSCGGAWLGSHVNGMEPPATVAAQQAGGGSLVGRDRQPAAGPEWVPVDQSDSPSHGWLTPACPDRIDDEDRADFDGSVQHLNAADHADWKARATTPTAAPRFGLGSSAIVRHKTTSTLTLPATASVFSPSATSTAIPTPTLTPTQSDSSITTTCSPGLAQPDSRIGIESGSGSPFWIPSSSVSSSPSGLVQTTRSTVPDTMAEKESREKDRSFLSTVGGVFGFSRDDASTTSSPAAASPAAAGLSGTGPAGGMNVPSAATTPSKSPVSASALTSFRSSLKGTSKLLSAHSAGSAASTPTSARSDRSGDPVAVTPTTASAVSSSSAGMAPPPTNSSSLDSPSLLKRPSSFFRRRKRSTVIVPGVENGGAVTGGSLVPSLPTPAPATAPSSAVLSAGSSPGPRYAAVPAHVARARRSIRTRSDGRSGGGDKGNDAGSDGRADTRSGTRPVIRMVVSDGDDGHHLDEEHDDDDDEDENDDDDTGNGKNRLRDTEPEGATRTPSLPHQKPMSPLFGSPTRELRLEVPKEGDDLAKCAGPDSGDGTADPDRLTSTTSFGSVLSRLSGVSGVSAVSGITTATAGTTATTGTTANTDGTEGTLAPATSPVEEDVESNALDTADAAAVDSTGVGEGDSDGDDDTDSDGEIDAAINRSGNPALVVGQADEFFDIATPVSTTCPVGPTEGGPAVEPFGEPESSVDPANKDDGRDDDDQPDQHPTRDRTALDRLDTHIDIAIQPDSDEEEDEMAGPSRVWLAPSDCSSVATSDGPAVRIEIAADPDGDDDDPTPDDEACARAIMGGDERVMPSAKVAAFLGDSRPTGRRTRRAFFALFDFRRVSIVAAFRQVCAAVAMRAESQQLDRLIGAFAARWVGCNSEHGFGCVDVVHAIAYSVLMLNTDLHMADIGAKMTMKQFVRNAMPALMSAAGGSEAVEGKGRAGLTPVPSMPDSALDCDSLVLVDGPASAYGRPWPALVEAVLRQVYNSISKDRLPLHAVVDSSPASPASSRAGPSAGLRRTPSVLSRTSDASSVRPTGRWRRRTDDERPAASADGRRRFGFAQAIREEGGAAAAAAAAVAAGTSTVGADDSTAATDAAFELAGPPWAKEGLLHHRPHADKPRSAGLMAALAERKSRHKGWAETFAVIQRGWLNLYVFGAKVSRPKKKKSGDGGADETVVGGGNWADRAEPVAEFRLRHAVATVLPAPFMPARPHVWALTLPSGQVHLFAGGTAELVAEWAWSANYWAARVSRPPLVGGVSNADFGWAGLDPALLEATDDDAVADDDDTGTDDGRLSIRDRRPSTSVRSFMSDHPFRSRRPHRRIRSGSGSTASLALSLRSTSTATLDGPALSPGPSPAATPTGRQPIIAEWTPPPATTTDSGMGEASQLAALEEYVASIEAELDRHHRLRRHIVAAHAGGRDGGSGSSSGRGLLGSAAGLRLGSAVSLAGSGRSVVSSTGGSGGPSGPAMSLSAGRSPGGTIGNLAAAHATTPTSLSSVSTALSGSTVGSTVSLALHPRSHSHHHHHFLGHGSSAGHSRALANWERKSKYLLSETVRFGVYVDALKRAADERGRVEGEMKERERQLAEVRAEAAARVRE